MLRVLFWNINGKPLKDALRQLCDIHSVDILVLAECRIPSDDLLRELNRGTERFFSNPVNLSNRVSFYTSLPDHCFASVTDDFNWSIWAIDPPVGQQILLVGVHYPSKLYDHDHEQWLLMPRLANSIREAEQRYHHSRTVVVGDLNMNPFEPGVCNAEGLHGVMCKRIAKRMQRKVHGKDRQFFYNPMWNFLGDETRGPPGTYYRAKGGTSYFWNTYDQVLYRPALLDGYQEGDVSIISEIAGKNLIRNDRIGRDGSDHLPLLFTVRN